MNDYSSIIGVPKVVGEIKALGNWNESSDYIDIYYDVLNASKNLPRNEYPSHLICNSITKHYLHNIDHNHNKFIFSLFRIFGYPEVREPSNILESIMIDIIIKAMIRIDNTLGDNEVLLVSNKNSIVSIKIIV